MGPGWAAYRGWYALKKSSGLLRWMTPERRTSGVDKCNGQGASVRAFLESQFSEFFIDRNQLPDRQLLRRTACDEGVARTIRVADDFAAGRFLYYSRTVVDHGRPVDWLRVLTHGASHHARTHWTRYPTFSPELGDVKTVWEPSRFAGAFWLGRAYALTGDEKYPAAFWELFESWVAQNPPNMGPNWKCGQEASLRAFAWLFAVTVFWNSPSTTAERMTAMTGLLIQTAKRVAANIDYAVSQKNNHGISEAAGLFTIGAMMPFVRFQNWEARGRRLLEKEVARQVYDDGSFVQHSMNYHRLMLHDCLWAWRVAESAGRPLSAEFKRRMALAAEFLFDMIDPGSGRVPNYGSNDGALILPLDACDYTDFRPVVQAAMFAATGRRVLPPGPHDEAGLWLFGEKFLSSEVELRSPRSRRFDTGGYYTIRGKRTWGVVRCHSYRDRPAHVDMLHFDLWADGRNILSDSGTFQYYSPDKPAFEKFFKDIAAHNTIEVGGRGPLELASRFMWVPWPEARCIDHSAARFVGEHRAYDREPWNVVHRRSIELMGNALWIVSDDLTGEGEREIVLRWHLLDAPYTMHTTQRWFELNTEGGKVRFSFDMPDSVRMTVRHGDDGSTPCGATSPVMGWQSLYYGEMSPRPTIELAGRVKLPMKITTRIAIEERAAS